VGGGGVVSAGDYRVDLEPIKRLAYPLVDLVTELEERRERMERVRAELLTLSRATEHPSRVRQRLGELAEELLACGPVALADEFRLSGNLAVLLLGSDAAPSPVVP
jgi:hypothetical protein